MLRLNGGQLFHDNALKTDDICFDGKILSIGSDSPDVSERDTIHLDGAWVLPGFIDTHVHFRDFGQAHKETWISGAQAAFLGGITTVFEMPNTDPPTTTPCRVIEKAKRAKSSGIEFGIWAGVCSENFDQLDDFCDLPEVIGFKLYMVPSGGDLALMAVQAQRRAFEAVAATGKVLAVHAEDPDLVNAGKRETPTCETKAVERALDLAQRTNVRLHIAHVSTSGSVDLVRAAKADGIDVTAEATPHHLLLTAPPTATPRWRVNPPLRREADRQALWEGLHDGTVDWIASDHAPHTCEEKDAGAPGFSGVGLMVPLLMNEVIQGRWSLQCLIEKCVFASVRRLNPELQTGIQIGAKANFTVIVPDVEKTIRGEEMSPKRWTPYEGRMLRGWPVMTVVNGQVRYADSGWMKGKGKAV